MVCGYRFVGILMPKPTIPFALFATAMFALHIIYHSITYWFCQVLQIEEAPDLLQPRAFLFVVLDFTEALEHRQDNNHNHQKREQGTQTSYASLIRGSCYGVSRCVDGAD